MINVIAKRISTTAALLLCLLAGAAYAQTSAQGPTVTLTPFARLGSTAFVPGAWIRAHGRVFDLTPDSFSPYQIVFSLVPSGQVVRTGQVGTDHALFCLIDIFGQPVSMDGVTGIRIVGFGINEIVPLTGGATPAPAAPTITNKGRYSSDEFPGTGVAFDGVIDFGNSSIIQIALFGSDFGNITTWIVRLSGNDAGGNPLVVEVRARAFGAGEEQSLPPLLVFLLGRSPVGSVQVQARAADNPAIASNTTTITVP